MGQIIQGNMKILENDENSIVPPLVAVSLRIYELTLARIPTIGPDIRYRNKTAYLVCESATPKQPKFWWSFGALLFALVWLICFCAALIKKIIYRNHVKMDILDAGQLVFFTLLIVVTIANIHTIFKHKDELTHLNRLLANKFELRCLRDSNEIFPGLLLTYYMIIIVIFAPLVPTVLHLIGVNPVVIATRVLSSEKWFPFPDLERFCSIHPWTVVPLLILLTVTFCISFKFLYIVLSFSILLGIAVQVYLNTLTKASSESHQLRYYNQLSVFFSFQRYLVSETAMNLIFWSQMVLSCLAWISINSFGSLPSIIIMAASTSFTCGVAIAAFLLNNFASRRIFSLAVIEKKKKYYYARYHAHCGRSGRQNHLYYWKAWTAQQPLPIYCGQRFPFSKAAVLAYLDVLNSNVTNSVILIR